MTKTSGFAATAFESDYRIILGAFWKTIAFRYKPTVWRLVIWRVGVGTRY